MSAFAGCGALRDENRVTVRRSARRIGPAGRGANAAICKRP
jgi:hypothetical protein